MPIGENITELVGAEGWEGKTVNGFLNFFYEGTSLNMYAMVGWDEAGTGPLTINFPAPQEIWGKSFAVEGWTYYNQVNGMIRPMPGDPTRGLLSCWVADPNEFNNQGHAYVHAEGVNFA